MFDSKPEVSRKAGERKWDDLDRLAHELVKTQGRPEALLLVALWPERNGWSVRAQHEVLSYRLDLAIPEARLFVEIDGHEWHSSNSAMGSDHERQNQLVAAGWTPHRCSAARAFVSPGPVAMKIVARVKTLLSPVRAVPRPGVAKIRDRSPVIDPAVGAAQLLKALEAGPASDLIVPRRRVG